LKQSGRADQKLGGAWPETCSGGLQLDREMGFENVKKTDPDFILPSLTETARLSET